MFVSNPPTNFLGNFSSDPSFAQEGQFYYNTGSGSYYWYNGSTWTEIGGAVGGSETTTTLGTLINGATAKTTPVDADNVPITDSAASHVTKKVTWANIKATLLSYFNSIYQPLISGASISTATVAGDDKVIIQDTSDSNNIKTVTAQAIADLGSGGGIGGSTGGADNAILRADGTGGSTVQGSLVTINDSGHITAGRMILNDTTANMLQLFSGYYLGIGSGSMVLLSSGVFEYRDGSSNIYSQLGTSEQRYASGVDLRWSGTANDATAALDVGLGRASAGVLKITNGSSGNGSLTVADDAYASGWNGSTQVPTKNALYDKIETLASLSGSETLTNKTLTSPTINGGTITGVIDAGGATSLEIPNSATPTVDTNGEVAIDTSVADFSHGVMKYFSGEEMAVVAMPVAELTTPADGHVVAYNATNDEFELVAPSTGGSVDISGTPTAGQFAKWTDANTLEGVSGIGINDATAKTTPVDADNILISDSADSHNSKKVTWANVKTTLFGDGLDADTSVGFRGIPQNSQSAAYTLVASDAGKHIFHPVGDNNPRTFTIPANSSVAFEVGTTITFINKINTVTIAITSDTLTFAEDGSTGSRTLAANGVATAIKITSTEWIISGVGLT